MVSYFNLILRKNLTGKPQLAYYRAVNDVFESISAPIRRAIMDELCERDGQTLFELCSRLAMKHGITATRQGISQHLDVLESAGLVSTERQGRYKFHYFCPAPLNVIVDRWLSKEKRREN